MKLSAIDTKNVFYAPETLYRQAQKTPEQRVFYFPDLENNLWHEMTWGEYWQKVAKTAGWLKAQGIKAGDKIIIFSANRPDWFIADLAILSVGAVSVPIYATLAPRDVKFIVEHSESRMAFVDDQQRAHMLSDSAAERVIVFDQPAGGHQDPKRISLQEIYGCTETTSLTKPDELQDDDIATIVYTSGTTGVPKGVVHSHGNVRFAMAVVKDVLKNPQGQVDRYFSFLPLSHVAERVLVELGSLYTGGEVSFARNIKTVAEDLQACRPTILLCVPRLWEKIYEKIQVGLQSASPVKRRVFALAKYLGSSRIQGDFIYPGRGEGLAAKISDALVGNKLKQKLGMDRVRMAVTGSAPTRPDVMRFFASFGICILEVYGLTENVCLGVLNERDRMLVGKCGRPFPGNEMRLADDGEILFKAPWMFKGYYKNQEATDQVLSKDGWFATGDLGAVDSDGYLKIVGRKKELLKTSGGKYIAPVPIEDRFKEHSIIGEAMVVGDGEKYCVALLALDPEVVTESAIFSKKADIASICEMVNRDLASFESIKKIGVLRQGFSIENGTLTPTMKLKRSVAFQMKKDFVTKVYESTEMVIFEP